MYNLNIQGFYFSLQFGEFKTAILPLPITHLSIHTFVHRTFQGQVSVKKKVRYTELINPHILITVQQKGGREASLSSVKQTSKFQGLPCEKWQANLFGAEGLRSVGLEGLWAEHRPPGAEAVAVPADGDRWLSLSELWLNTTQLEFNTADPEDLGTRARSRGSSLPSKWTHLPAFKTNV